MENQTEETPNQRLIDKSVEGATRVVEGRKVGRVGEIGIGKEGEKKDPNSVKLCCEAGHYQMEGTMGRGSILRQEQAQRTSLNVNLVSLREKMCHDVLIAFRQLWVGMKRNKSKWTIAILLPCIP